MLDRASLLTGYVDAKERVVAAGYAGDIMWAEGLDRVQPDPPYMLREFGWVVVNSGFRYAVARKLWPGLLRAFHGFHVELVTGECLPAALAVLNHPGKLGAIVAFAELLRAGGAPEVLEDAKGPLRLCRLPWIGKITCWHLAKVYGVDCVKPDVHLTRAAVAAGAASPLELCAAIRDALGDRLTVVDSVLWRYGEQRAKRGWADWDGVFRAR